MYLLAPVSSVTLLFPANVRILVVAVWIIYDIIFINFSMDYLFISTADQLTLFCEYFNAEKKIVLYLKLRVIS